MILRILGMVLILGTIAYYGSVLLGKETFSFLTSKNFS